LTSEQLLDRILGVIYGNALGDAIGLSTEFMSKEGALFNYDLPIDFNSFVDDRHRSKWIPGDWTDDTDQMILIMQV
jgi:ADP-ribosylglycohydrolase